jgi:Variant SH3 domain
LSFNAGEEIKIEKKRDNGWWIGHCNGIRGYFPHNYVEEMEVSIIEKRKDSEFGSFIES